MRRVRIGSDPCRLAIFALIAAACIAAYIDHLANRYVSALLNAAPTCSSTEP